MIEGTYGTLERLCVNVRIRPNEVRHVSNVHADFDSAVRKRSDMQSIVQVLRGGWTGRAAALSGVE